jgi:hypothetical protein
MATRNHRAAAAAAAAPQPANRGERSQSWALSLRLVPVLDLLFACHDLISMCPGFLDTGS